MQLNGRVASRVQTMFQTSQRTVHILAKKTSDDVPTKQVNLERTMFSSTKAEVWKINLILSSILKVIVVHMYAFYGKLFSSMNNTTPCSTTRFPFLSTARFRKPSFMLEKNPTVSRHAISLTKVDPQASLIYTWRN